jgi:lysophospholipase L1-like esterase
MVRRQGRKPALNSRALSAAAVCIGVLLPLLTAIPAPSGGQERFDDHKQMMQQLGVKALRRGPNPNDQSTFDEATANPYRASMPNPLRMNDGTEVKRSGQWPKRRAEIVEDFEREVYGRVPVDVPKVTWEVTGTTRGDSNGIPTVTKTLVGHVDNSAHPQLSVDIQASYTVPASAKKPVPIMVEFSFGFGRPGFEPAWNYLAISKGWGYGKIVPTSIQPDNNRLTTGIVGLTNKGRPRTPDQWGALRAWAWGASRLIDYFEQDRASMVDPKKVGIAGLSRYGKAAVVAQAFDTRVAVGLIGSSGEGGTKLHRHIYGEAVENLAGGLYYWMAGNFIKYAASDPPKTAADLPVDSHQLIALCAPRPCFISHGTVERGDAKWIDARGSFMAAVLAGPVYRLHGKRDLGTPGDYLSDAMPPVGTLFGGELAWRQHEGGHDISPNWPSFFEWAGRYIKAPPLSKQDQELARRLPAEIPAPRGDRNSMLAHQQLVAKAKAGGIDLYFLGDSIVRRWGASDRQYAPFLANWNKNFFGWNAGNFGWGADRIENILWRMENGELDGVNPKVIVLQAGTNNVGSQPAGVRTIEEVTKGIQALIRVCRTKAPRSTIIVTAIFPRNDSPAAMPVIDAINRRLARLADGRQVRFLNVHDRLADKEGRLFEGMMNAADRLHPTEQGYQVWADGLRPILTELLGPPASTDHAPPPTGDPSASPAPAPNRSESSDVLTLLPF